MNVGSYYVERVILFLMIFLTLPSKLNPSTWEAGKLCIPALTHRNRLHIYEVTTCEGEDFPQN